MAGLPFEFPIQGSEALRDPAGMDWRDRELEQFLARSFAAWTPDVFTASGTWEKRRGLAFVIAQVQGVGGGSGGCPATAAGQAAMSGPGGGGGFAWKLIPASALADSEPVTLGTPGAAGAAGANAGGTGTVSSFGAHCSANSGAGGAAGVAGTAPRSGENSGAGGTATGGDFNIAGSYGIVLGAYATRISRSPGGASHLGPNSDDNGNTTGAAGGPGRVYGGGAGASFNCQSQASTRAGAAGAPGIIIVINIFGGR